MNLKTVLGWAVIAFLAFYLVTNPSGAGHNAGQILHGLDHVAGQLATFLGSI